MLKTRSQWIFVFTLTGLGLLSNAGWFSQTIHSVHQTLRSWTIPLSTPAPRRDLSSPSQVKSLRQDTFLHINTISKTELDLRVTACQRLSLLTPGENAFLCEVLKHKQIQQDPLNQNQPVSVPNLPGLDEEDFSHLSADGQEEENEIGPRQPPDMENERE